ncbi:peptidoglycan recognition protein [Actinoplanes sp. DH11]|uniref:peptidoglycan recognition protein family protein n=1 Tax=Actinoplanes sp. DH11 TaxID=2857011 RepID=UPI001E2DA8B0|nr:peptidoglycan recognition protein [Actinoplanes sp. DH11]
MRRNRLTTRLLAALVAATPAVAVAIAGTVPQPADPVRSSGPVLQTFALTPGEVRGDGLRLAGAAARAVTAPAAAAPAVAAPTVMRGGAEPLSGGRAELPPRRTEPFSMVGVTWADPRVVSDGRIEVRTRTAGTGRWTPWQLLETDNPDASGGAEGPGARGASDPLWVGLSDGVEARVEGARTLPRGMRVDLINPDGEGVGEAPEMRPGAAASGRDRAEIAGRAQNAGRAESAGRARNAGRAQNAGRAGSAARRAGGNAADRARRNPVLPARPVPRMVTRAGWGANEGSVADPPSYTGAIKIVFVHHTATGNGYTCGQSASIVRGIATYQVKSKGWNDIGYNFLVDKCGTVFEGRGGGVHRSVLGAHTLGFNDNASAIAVIGDFRSVRIPVAARAAVAQVAAYKLGAWGSPPAGRVALVSGGSNKHAAGRAVTFSRISGHRDAGSTECPGTALYRQLPAIRTIAGGAPIGLRFQQLGGASAAAGKFYSRGLVQPLWDLSTPTRMLDRFEVWLDGRMFVATPAGHRRARVRLSPGEHTLAIKAVHLSGRTSVTSARIIADPVPPAFPAEPQVSLRTGTMSDAVPVRVSWGARDAHGLRSVRVTGTARAVLGATARAHDAAARLGEANAWTVTAADRAGNVRSASVTRTPVLVAEAGARRTGTWRTARDPRFLGSEAAAASARGASMSWTFTGRSAALVAGRTATSGRIRVFLDGRDQGVVDLRSSGTRYRQAVWTRMWPTAGTHTVTVQVEGTAGRPSVLLDGLTYLR